MLGWSGCEYLFVLYFANLPTSAWHTFIAPYQPPPHPPYANAPPPPPPPTPPPHPPSSPVAPGGEVVSEDLGHKLEKTELTQLGSVKKVTVTKDDTIMLHGGGEGAQCRTCMKTCEIPPKNLQLCLCWVLIMQLVSMLQSSTGPAAFNCLSRCHVHTSLT
jgi:hypothetical protein